MEITEQQIVEWFKARSKEIQSERGLAMRALTLYVDATSGTYFSWTAHASGECASSFRTLDEAADLLSRKLGSPVQLAAKKRAEAAALIAEADKLEGKIKLEIAA